MRTLRCLVALGLDAGVASAARLRVLPFGLPTRRTGPLALDAVRRAGVAARVVFAPRSERIAVVFAALVRVVAAAVPRRPVDVRVPVLRVRRPMLRPALALVVARALVALRVTPALGLVAATPLVVLVGELGRGTLVAFVRSVVARVVRVVFVLARDGERVDAPGLDFAFTVREVLGAARFPVVAFATVALLRGALVVTARVSVLAFTERPLDAAGVRPPRAVVRPPGRVEVVRRPLERIAIALERALSEPVVLAFESSLLI